VRIIRIHPGSCDDRGMGMPQLVPAAPPASSLSIRKEQKLNFARNLLYDEASTGDEGELAAC